MSGYKGKKELRSKRGKIYHKTNGHCGYCGIKLDPFEGWNIEHMISRKHGGSDDLENLVASCALCNGKKNWKSINEFRRFVPDKAVELFDNLRDHLEWASTMLPIDARKLVDELLEVWLEYAEGLDGPAVFFIDRMESDE